MERSHTWQHAGPSADDEKKKSLRSRTFSQPRRLLLPRPTALIPSPLPSPPPPAPLPILKRLATTYPAQSSLAKPTSSLPALSAQTTARETELQTSFSALSRSALAATQRLDAAYDALLSRTAALSALLAALAGTHAAMASGRAEFRAQAEKLAGETAGVVEGYAGFGAQGDRVRALGGRLEEAREKAGRVRERLDKVKGRIGGMERVEERRGREGWWWRVSLGVLAGLAGVVLLAIWALRRERREEVGMHIEVGGDRAARWRVLDEL